MRRRAIVLLCSLGAGTWFGLLADEAFSNHCRTPRNCEKYSRCAVLGTGKCTSTFNIRDVDDCCLCVDVGKTDCNSGTTAVCVWTYSSGDCVVDSAGNDCLKQAGCGCTNVTSQSFPYICVGTGAPINTDCTGHGTTTWQGTGFFACSH